jgi:COP9 signalosome complex subunit 5
MSGQAAAALQTFELENEIQALDPADAVFRYDAAAQRAIEAAKPWRADPRFFKQCVPVI